MFGRVSLKIVNKATVKMAVQSGCRTDPMAGSKVAALTNVNPYVTRSYCQSTRVRIP
jgi:hypothetical protein